MKIYDDRYIKFFLRVIFACLALFMLYVLLGLFIIVL